MFGAAVVAPEKRDYPLTQFTAGFACSQDPLLRQIHERVVGKKRMTTTEV
jgi:hypothetical protein